mgnify:CR=1 FL=1
MCCCCCCCYCCCFCMRFCCLSLVFFGGAVWGVRCILIVWYCSWRFEYYLLRRSRYDWWVNQLNKLQNVSYVTIVVNRLNDDNLVKIRGGVAQWVAHLIRNVEVVGSSPIKGPRCFLEQETLPLLLSTGWFQERIRTWFHNRTNIDWRPYGRLTQKQKTNILWVHCRLSDWLS